ncbi:MAG: hypothetical protein OIN83_11725 [Candidatus Methanoperedens sp.]|nr:hypothetical protein [Candidatus Methanoperedens sp.]
MDYKTIGHLLEVLVKHGMIMKNHLGYPDLYLISNNIAESLYSFDNEKSKL